MKKVDSDWTEEAWTDFNSCPGTKVTGASGSQLIQKAVENGKDRTKRSEVPSKESRSSKSGSAKRKSELDVTKIMSTSENTNF